jgi:hypothetical protein
MKKKEASQVYGGFRLLLEATKEKTPPPSFLGRFGSSWEKHTNPKSKPNEKNS